ncbi:phospholipase D [Ameyamaea chiangmaiensis NBRC 103196]|nr:phospholipase D [Ameyamaea chiangmaiensis NBRC 103196]
MLAGRIALAVAVTLHVLRTKRDTSASIGWIGIAWMMPILGSGLYVMFGVNRVRRLARKLVRHHHWNAAATPGEHKFKVEGSLAPLALMVGKLTERPILRGNLVRMLHDGDEAYPQMLAAIGEARTSVLLCSYIFRGDAIGQQFVDALIAAHRRGVMVRVLVDGIGSGYLRCPVARALGAGGVPCGRFMHSVWPWRMPFINLRNHRKILVVDGMLGFMGGLNIGQENVLRLKTHEPVADTHFRLEGPVVRQLTEAFVRDWSFTKAEDLSGEAIYPALTPRGEAPARIVTAGPDADLEKIEYAMLQAISLSRRSVRLMTPYFLPDDRFTTELALASMRGVEVDIVVPARSNHVVIDWARDAGFKPLLDAGCRVWLARAPFNHSKLMCVDREWSFVGSSNLDIRSLRLNFEINLEVYDEAQTQRIDGFICEHRHKRLTHHDLDNRSTLVKLRDASARLMQPYL